MVSLLPLLQRLGASYDELGDGAAIDGDTLLSLIDNHGFFNGFDEMWFFHEQPYESKPETIPLTSDVPLQQAPSDILVSWMRDSGCIAGLGDGIGLNYVTFSPRLAELWSS